MAHAEKSGPRARGARQAGFTLVEMMVVIVIIGILATVMITQLSGRTEKARQEGTKAMIRQIDLKLVEFKLNHHRYPEKLEDLFIMPPYVDARTWPPGGYLKEPPMDQWSNRYEYRVPGTGGQPFDIVSYGEDGRPGGDGVNEDLWNHQAYKR